MRITLRLFATLRDRAGVGQAEIELAEGAKVVDLLDVLATRYPAIKPALATTLVAVNEEYALPENVLTNGDTVALFPPVSGGSTDEYPEYFAITPDRLDLDAIVATITRPETGAVCVFSGTVRGVTHSEAGNQATSYLYYESYEAMAEKVLRQVAREIREQFPKVQGIAIVQRIGRLEVGQTTILVACSAGHRNDGCFEAARYGIDRVKEIVPIWKKEIGPSGELWVEGHYHPTPNDISHERSKAGKGRPAKDADSPFQFGCVDCGEVYSFTTQAVMCHCGGAFQFVRSPQFRRGEVCRDEHGLWRYRRFLIPEAVDPVTLGEGWTPLIEVQAFGRTIGLKLENLNPTGSFKDRGAAVLVSVLKIQDITSVHDDSSGNAGAALAAYAARAGIRARLFVPKSAAAQKLAQIRIYGAALEVIDGPRSEAARAAEEEAVKPDTYYASHIWNPFSVFAHKTIAYELWEQLGERAPDAVVLPLGHGSQLLGLAQGFEELYQIGVIERVPQLFGVQAEVCAPLWAMHRSDANTPVAEKTTLAEGVRIIHPIRAKQVLEAITRSGGDILAATEDEIIDGIRTLAHFGIMVEPTSALVWPALTQVSSRLPQNAMIVASITGSGQKVPGLDALLRSHEIN